MIWLTWRQHRAQALYFLVALAVLAAVLVPLGLTMFRALDRSRTEQLPRHAYRG